MDASAAFLVHNGTITLRYLTGRGDTAFVPSEIDALPVRAVADYAFAPRAAEYAPDVLCGPALRCLFLPEGITSVGRYAFYGCTSLEEMHLPSTLRSIGSGAFTACTHLKTIFLNLPADGGTPPAMKDILSCLPQEVEVVLMRQRSASGSPAADRSGDACAADGTVGSHTADGDVYARLVFPEYYENGIENTPARIIAVEFIGTGYQYRQCFSALSFRADTYDSLFPLAVAQQELTTCLRLAADRILYPAHLSDTDRETYAAFLREHAERLAELFFQQRLFAGPENPDEAQLLTRLVRSNIIDSENVRHFLRAAAEAGAAESSAVLMDLCHPGGDGREGNEDREGEEGGGNSTPGRRRSRLRL